MFVLNYEWFLLIYAAGPLRRASHYPSSLLIEYTWSKQSFESYLALHICQAICSIILSVFFFSLFNKLLSSVF